jgi:hypothetical protein
MGFAESRPRLRPPPLKSPSDSKGGSLAFGRRHFFALSLLGAQAILSGCSTRPRKVRSRLTLYVDTPEGERTGSAVIEELIVFQDGLFGAFVSNTILSGLHGEATVVDLGSRGLLFSLLSSDPSRPHSVSAPGLSYVAFPEPERPRTPYKTEEFLAAYYDDLNRRKPAGEVPLDRLPMLVRFRDTDDPKTVERVDPRNLTASFGPGVKLVRATIEVTGRSVTTGIEKAAPSYRNRGDWYAWLLKLPHGDPRAIGLESFHQGF